MHLQEGEDEAQFKVHCVDKKWVQGQRILILLVLFFWCCLCLVHMVLFGCGYCWRRAPKMGVQRVQEKRPRGGDK